MDTRREQLRTLGFNIAHLREERDISQTDLAHMLGYTGHAHVSRIESGERAPSIKALLTIAEILDVSASDLFDGV